MKIVIISTSDINGGASVAAYRLFLALQESGVAVKMLVMDKRTKHPDIATVCNSKWKVYRAHALLALEKITLLPQLAFRKDIFYFSTGQWGHDVSQHPWVLAADIIHFHWINHAFLSLKSIEKIIALGKPVVSHLHDMWAFTGGCNYAGTCENFKSECGSCKLLKNPNAHDLSHKIHLQKQKIYQSENLSFAASSQNLLKIAQSSSLFKNKKSVAIPIPVDDKIFYPIPLSDAFQALRLNTSKKLILFGVHNVAEKRKGFIYFQQAIEILAHQNKNFKEEVAVLMFGKCPPELIQQFPIEVIYLGVLHAAQIMQAYNASSMYVLPSLEDNLPNTVLESLACATPVVAFHTGGIPEMIEHKKNGYLSDYCVAESLAEGIQFTLENKLQVQLHPKYSNVQTAAAALEFYHSLL